jgi:tetratricopeptide (TPR) repeat protein
MYKGLLTILFCLSIWPFLCAQPQQQIDRLSNAYNKATNDPQRIQILGKLAEYLSIYKLEKQADSILQKQLTLAELSQDKELIFDILFSESITYIGSWTNKETFDRAMRFIQQGLDYATETGRNDYEALAYIRKCMLLRKMGQYDNALQQATLAFSSLGNDDQDSIRTVLYIELGNIYNDQGDAVNAFKNYNNAFDIAYNMKNVPLQSAIYHRYSELYKSLADNDQAKAYLLTSLQLNTKNNYAKGRLNDYIDLARITDKKIMIEKALALADSLHNERLVLYAKRLMFTYYMVIEKNSEKALHYLNENPDFKQTILNTSLATYYYSLGNIYYFSGNIDSALYYFKLGEPELERSYDRSSRMFVYQALGDCYMQLNKPENAKTYYLKAFDISKAIPNFNLSAVITDSLSKVFYDQGNYKQAFEFSFSHRKYVDTLDQLQAKHDVALLDVQKENRKREKDLQDQEKERLRRIDAQYLSMFFVVASLFLIMILIGMFPVSKLVIRIFTFIAFICLFELIVLIAEHTVHDITHGEPLYIWIFKIVLIALLVPVQHYMEHGLLNFLTSRKLVHMRSKISIKKLWLTNKKPVPQHGTGIEEDTAVL